MRQPALPPDEAQRLFALHSLNLLDSLPEERFDRLTRLARKLLDVEIAAISLVDEDRQWFKSRQGLETAETARDVSFCGHAILEDEILVVPDATQDERFADNPMVDGQPNIRFYAGCPIAGPGGHKLGTLCVIDSQPRELGEDERAHLRDLANMVEDELVMQEMAITDPLSGLCNRRGFEVIASNTLSVCRRLGYAATLAYFDVAGMKAINASAGHDAGDRLLIEFSMLMSDSFRSSDVVARLGSDKFCALLSASSSARADPPLRRLQDGVEQRNASHPDLPAIHFRFGLTAFDPREHKGVQDLLHDADAKLHEQKRARRAESASPDVDTHSDDVAA